MKAIIFGINGQDGHYLSQILVQQNIEVIGVSRTKGNWITGNVADRFFVEKIIKEQLPDYVFHLAANSTTSHAPLFENHATISGGAINILESVNNNCPNARVFLSGSAMQFKNSGKPIDEETPFDPSSPYSVERIYTTNLARYYRNKFGMRVYTGYFFNHDSPLRTDRHINQKIAFAVQRIRNGSPEKLTIGNIDVQKEFNFAGDLMNAVWILVNQTSTYEAIIGSGESYLIKEWLDCCFKIINKNWREYVEVMDNFIPEYTILVSNPSRIKSLGWKPLVTMEELATMMVCSN